MNGMLFISAMKMNEYKSKMNLYPPWGSDSAIDDKICPKCGKKDCKCGCMQKELVQDFEE